MFKLQWSEQALRDFEAALAYIAAENPSNAQLVRDRILRTVKHLESYSLGLPAPNGTLKLFVPGTPYFVVFRRSMEGDISIRAFIHSARDWERIDWENL